MGIHLDNLSLIMSMHTYIVLVFGLVLPVVWGHGRMTNPPGRSTMFKYGFKNPANWDDDGLNCGGIGNHVAQGYKCGLCGDPYQGPRHNEAGGKYANGIIVKTYRKGSVIDVDVEITTNHKGWQDFHLCPNNNPNKPITQACLDRYPLRLVSAQPASVKNDRIKHYLGSKKGMMKLRLQLPAGVTCTQCVLQWRYHAGNSWGFDEGDWSGCMGCGKQEEFYACADIAIR